MPLEARVFTVAVALPILGLVVVILLLVEVRQYRAGRHLISRRRFALRMAAGLLLLLLLAAVFVGLFALKLRSAAARTEQFLAYWSGCLLVAVALVWVMLADMREVGDRFLQRQHEMWRDMAQFIAAHMTREGGPSRPEDDAPE